MGQKWSVRKRDGRWRVYDPTGGWHDTCDSSQEAHTYAAQQSVVDEVFEPGGLTRLRIIQSIARQRVTVVEGWHGKVQTK
jgi:hypothetical protein